MSPLYADKNASEKFIREPKARIRDLSSGTGLTERATQRIVSELVDAGYVTRIREGRRNHYTVDLSRSMRHPLWGEHTVGELLGHLICEEQTIPAAARG